MTDVSDPAVALALNRGLIPAARLKVVVTDERHVALFRPVLCRGGSTKRDAEHYDECRPTSHTTVTALLLSRAPGPAPARESAPNLTPLAVTAAVT